MAQSPIQTAIQQIASEKNLSEESVLHAIELALAAAYRKDFGNKLQNIIAEFDAKTGEVKVVDFKTVVEDLPEEELDEEGNPIFTEESRDAGTAPSQKSEKDAAYVAEEDEEEVRKFNPKTEIQLKDAKELDKKYKVGDEIITPLEVPGDFGRMAAQTAKQVIVQKLREEERENIFNEYKDFEGQVIDGTVQRREGRNVLVDLSNTTAMLPPEEQIPGERYNVGNRMRFYLRSVEQTTRGPQLVVSRAHTEIVKKVFEVEIPEIANGIIEIKSISREAGSRSKVAIHTTDDGIDPIGSCVGQRGARIQTITSELAGEKVDIILWDEDPVKFITNALSPAKILSVELEGEDEEEKSAKVTVNEDQLSLAIGRGGQNVRLASRLTGWKIDIISDGKPAEAEEKEEKKEDVETGHVPSEESDIAEEGRDGLPSVSEEETKKEKEEK